MNTKKMRSLLALIMALAMILSLTACSSREEPVVEPEEPEIITAEAGTVFMNPLETMDLRTSLSSVLDDLTPLAAQSYEINEDTIGWLRVPGTTIDDVVVHYPDSTDKNRYYLRRSLDRRTSNDGTYFADYRNTFDGTANGLSRNTVIYGHSFTDMPTGTLFSQLKNYLNEDFARENPYIYFSTNDENLAWEVFAVYYATVSLPYNIPDQTDEEFMDVIEQCLLRSRYIYDVDITPSDKILTLSTCTYLFSDTYPNDYRYVVMARLVSDDEELRDTAAFTANPSPQGP